MTVHTLSEVFCLTYVLVPGGTKSTSNGVHDKSTVAVGRGREPNRKPPISGSTEDGVLFRKCLTNFALTASLGAFPGAGTYGGYRLSWGGLVKGEFRVNNLIGEITGSTPGHGGRFSTLNFHSGV